MKFITSTLWALNGGIFGILPTMFFAKTFIPNLFNTGEYKFTTFWISFGIFVPTGMYLGTKFLKKLQNSTL